MILPALIPFMILEGFRYDEIGLFFSISVFLYGSGALTAGYIATKLGERRGILISIFLQGASALLILADGFLGPLLFLASLGFFGSFYHPLSYSYIYRRFEKYAGEAMGLHGVGANVGQIVYPALGVLIALQWGWRYAILFFGIIIMLSSMFILKFPSSPPYTKSKLSFYLELLLEKRFILLVIFALSFGLYFRGIELYLPSFLKDVKGFEIMVAGISSSILMAGGALGQYLGGKIGDKKGPEIAILLVSIIGASSLLVLRTFSSMLIIMGAIFLFGSSFYGQQPACNLYLARKFGGKVAAMTYSVWFFITFSFMSLSTYLAGFLIQNYGFVSLFYFSTIISIAVVFLAFYIFLRERFFIKNIRSNMHEVSLLVSFLLPASLIAFSLSSR